MWEEWGWRAPTDQAERIPLLNSFPKCPMRGSLVQANLSAILTVSSVSVIDL